MTTSTPAPGGQPACAFDPHTWLSQFETVGGAYACCNSALHLWIVPAEQTIAEPSEARRMLIALTSEQREAITAWLRLIKDGAPEPDWGIKAAWKRWQDAYAAYCATPPESPSDTRLIEACEAAEVEIHNSIAATPQGIAIQLMVALHHSSHTTTRDAQLATASIEELHADDTFDWNDRLVIAALRSLKSMEAGQC